MNCEYKKLHIQCYGNILMYQNITLIIPTTFSTIDAPGPALRVMSRRAQIDVLGQQF